MSGISLAAGFGLPSLEMHRHMRYAGTEGSPEAWAVLIAVRDIDDRATMWTRNHDRRRRVVMASDPRCHKKIIKPSGFLRSTFLLEVFFYSGHTSICICYFTVNLSICRYVGWLIKFIRNNSVQT